MCLRCPEWCHTRKCTDYRLKSIFGFIKLRTGCFLYGLLLVVLNSGLIGMLICYEGLLNKAEQTGHDRISAVDATILFGCLFLNAISGVILLLAIVLVSSILVRKLFTQILITHSYLHTHTQYNVRSLFVYLFVSLTAIIFNAVGLGFVFQNYLLILIYAIIGNIYHFLVSFTNISCNISYVKALKLYFWICCFYLYLDYRENAAWIE